MVEIKVDTDEILFRIVFAGRDRATKFATLRSLQARIDDGTRPMIVMHAGGDRVIGFDLTMPEADRLFGMKVRIEVLARPGTRHSVANDILLHRSADAIIWLDDRSNDGSSEAAESFDVLVGELETLGRKAQELPILVQCYADAGADRRRVYKGLRKPWKPRIHVIGDDLPDELAVFESARAAVFEAYRGYEKELAKAGLGDHVKIRDRVYERLSTVPAERDDLPGPEFRLVRSQPLGRPRNDLFISALLFGALLSALGLAFWMALSL